MRVEIVERRERGSENTRKNSNAWLTSAPTRDQTILTPGQAACKSRHSPVVDIPSPTGTKEPARRHAGFYVLFIFYIGPSWSSDLSLMITPKILTSLINFNSLFGEYGLCCHWRLHLSGMRQDLAYWGSSW